MLIHQHKLILLQGPSRMHMSLVEAMMQREMKAKGELVEAQEVVHYSARQGIPCGHSASLRQRHLNRVR
ncbi:CASP-like protein 2 [Pyrus ussuriensis x Pyrus communis]|uniref:CASP-like protein 2 n=1 Tax=Pyrus ussuriensis x Pyrus communis TaxID=2448454 RepID=A0A5N5EYM1_9ROSA|nr:CASP-like protein 2 [Pyrus ussuriensis x Pyrus communis]